MTLCLLPVYLVLGYISIQLPGCMASLNHLNPAASLYLVTDQIGSLMDSCSLNES